MRIDLTTFGVEPPANGQTGRAGANGASESAAGGTAAADPTRFSFDQTRVRSLENLVLAQPEVRAARVQSLQQAIRDGQYSIAPGEVAGALLKDLGGEARG